MKYFKLVNNGLIIGIAISSDFMHYSELTDNYVGADEHTGEYVSYNGKFYRDGWMQPFIHKENYLEVSIVEIDEIEYEALYEAFKTEQVVEEAKEIEAEETEYVAPVDTTSLDFVRTSKIREMSHTCNQLIEAGFDVELSDFKTHHFSLTTQDQLNLITLSTMAAQGIQQIPYHADGELCCFYSPSDINLIINGATAFKTYHTTYYNALKNYINHLNTVEEIAAITYGIELPLEYQSDVLKAIS